MDHFLGRIIAAQGADLSADMSVHNKLVRYSKGTFNGPALKLSIKGKTITIKGSVDYENALGALVIDTTTAPEVSLEGNIIAFEDPSALISKHFPRNELSTSSKGAKWIVIPSGTWRKEDAARLFAEFSKCHGYVLVKVTVPGDKAQSFTVKTKIPNNKGEYELDKATGFCTAKLANDESCRKRVMDMLIPDHVETALRGKDIVIENTYDIESLAIPQGSTIANKRLAAIRKGALHRRVEIDGKETRGTFKLCA